MQHAQQQGVRAQPVRAARAVAGRAHAADQAAPAAWEGGGVGQREKEGRGFERDLGVWC